MAFALSRPLRRLRLPVELAAAAALARAAPALRQVKVGTLFANVLGISTKSSTETPGKSTGMMARLLAVGNVIDDYGSPFTVVSPP